MYPNRDAWIEVDLSVIARNVRQLRKISRSKYFCAVVKADGYGHGAVKVASTALENGADRLAVATVDEALEIRATFPNTPVHIMGEIPRGCAQMLANQNIEATVSSLAHGERLQAEIEGPSKLKVHIKLDSGMGRIGMNCWAAGLSAEMTAENTAQIISDIRKISRMDKLEIAGIFSHFACADSADKTAARMQADYFTGVVKAAAAEGINLGIRHIANSAGIVDLPEYHFDMVRAGIILYGLRPSEQVDISGLDIEQAMSLKSRIAFLKKTKISMGISYGHIYRAGAGEYIATIPIGYADGLSRSLSGKLRPMIRSNIYNQIGRICMDQTMILVDENCREGDEVLIFGKSNQGFISADEIAQNLGTINYEIVCMMGKRVPRVYIDTAPHEEK